MIMFNDKYCQFNKAFELDRLTYGKMAEGVIETGKNLIERKPAESHLIAKKQVRHET